METVSVRPLLKWVGGKRQLLPDLRRFHPAAFDRYVEPFLGSGAVFFDLSLAVIRSAFGCDIPGFGERAGVASDEMGFRRDYTPASQMNSRQVGQA